MADSFFGNTEGLKSKLGYLILMENDANDFNIVHYGRNRFHRIARSIMAEEVGALIFGFDYAFFVRYLIE